MKNTNTKIGIDWKNIVECTVYDDDMNIKERFKPSDRIEYEESLIKKNNEEKGKEAMRDTNRIEPFLDKFKELWKLYPDYRFGQLVSMIEHRMDTKDSFYIEEDKWIEAIEKEIDETIYRRTKL